VPCCTHVGPDAAGHFVKMVHNGIEYADMQLIAEAYDLLRHGLDARPAEIAEVFRRWDSGDLDSFLIEITAEVLAHVDDVTGAPLVDVIRDEAGQKGTGRWTVQMALDLGVPVSGIAEAVFARSLSGQSAQRTEARAALPGPDGPWGVEDREAFVEDVRRALYASKVVAYAQGFDLIRAGSDEYGWGIDLGAMATIWRGGCIIRARFLDRIREAYERRPDLPTLLVDDYFRDAVVSGQDGWRRAVAGAAGHGVPLPGFSSALAYYDGVRAERLPAALIQGQRDLFGAHTYRRVDADGVFHVDWSGDRRQQVM
jgi:6-phosphogluconate dehydrogenase